LFIEIKVFVPNWFQWHQNCYTFLKVPSILNENVQNVLFHCIKKLVIPPHKWGRNVMQFGQVRAMGFADNAAQKVRSVLPRPNVIKLSTSIIYNVCNNLECLPLAGLSSLV
jgi:hypothetical protein